MQTNRNTEGEKERGRRRHSENESKGVVAERGRGVGGRGAYSQRSTRLNDRQTLVCPKEKILSNMDCMLRRVFICGGMLVRINSNI